MGQRGHSKSRGLIFLQWKKKRKSSSGNRMFVRRRILSTVNRANFVNDRVSYIFLRGCWCNVIVLNVHAPSEEKSDVSNDSFYGELDHDFYHFPKYQLKILLEDFNAKVGRKNFYKPTIGNESLHQDSNDNGVRKVNFDTLQNLVVKSTMYPHRDVHKYNWTSPDKKTHNQIDHILIDRRLYSSVLEVRSFNGGDCVTDHYLVVEEVRERLAVSKQKPEKFDGE